MIHLQVYGHVEELEESSYAGGLKLLIEGYDDETGGVQVGNMITEVDKKTLLRLVNNLSGTDD